jgi:hypothetical protein
MLLNQQPITLQPHSSTTFSSQRSSLHRRVQNSHGHL